MSQHPEQQITEHYLRSEQIVAEVTELHRLFQEEIRQPIPADLGTETRVSFRSSMEPEGGYPVLREYETAYPQIVTEALLELIEEYNQAFIEIINAHRNSPSEYQYCYASDGVPSVLGLQIDMQALPPQFLEACASGDFSRVAVKQFLRRNIFELENSLAMTPLLERLFVRGEGDQTLFSQAMRATLEGVRQRTGKRVVMLAVTQSKYEAILASEFGANDQTEISRDFIQTHSGLDDVWGPTQYQAYAAEVAEGRIPDDVLFYVRSSLPVAKLKQPDGPSDPSDDPLLSDPDHLAFIRQRALTTNVDPQEADTAMNDTKKYMSEMGMGYQVDDLKDVYSRPYYLRLFLTDLQRHVESLLSQTQGEQKKRLNELKRTLSGAIINLKNTAEGNKVKQKAFYQTMDALHDALSNVGWLGSVASIIDLSYSELLMSRGNPFQPQFVAYKEEQGISVDDLLSGDVSIRAKPLAMSYGCYGHKAALHPMNMARLQSDIATRGSYVLQPEMPPVLIEDESTGVIYQTIDRNFFLLGPDGKTYISAGGFRSMLPMETREAQAGRIHGSTQTKWAPVTY